MESLKSSKLIGEKEIMVTQSEEVTNEAKILMQPEIIPLETNDVPKVKEISISSLDFSGMTKTKETTAKKEDDAMLEEKENIRELMVVADIVHDLEEELKLSKSDNKGTFMPVLEKARYLANNWYSIPYGYKRDHLSILRARAQKYLDTHTGFHLSKGNRRNKLMRGIAKRADDMLLAMPEYSFIGETCDVKQNEQYKKAVKMRADEVLEEVKNIEQQQLLAEAERLTAIEKLPVMSFSDVDKVIMSGDFKKILRLMVAVGKDRVASQEYATTKLDKNLYRDVETDEHGYSKENLITGIRQNSISQSIPVYMIRKITEQGPDFTIKLMEEIYYAQKSLIAAGEIHVQKFLAEHGGSFKDEKYAKAAALFDLGASKYGICAQALFEFIIPKLTSFSLDYMELFLDASEEYNDRVTINGPAKVDYKLMPATDVSSLIGQLTDLSGAAITLDIDQFKKRLFANWTRHDVTQKLEKCIKEKQTRFQLSKIPKSDEAMREAKKIARETCEYNKADETVDAAKFLEVLKNLESDGDKLEEVFRKSASKRRQTLYDNLNGSVSEKQLHILCNSIYNDINGKAETEEIKELLDASLRFTTFGFHEQIIGEAKAKAKEKGLDAPEYSADYKASVDEFVRAVQKYLDHASVEEDTQDEIKEQLDDFKKYVFEM